VQNAPTDDGSRMVYRFEPEIHPRQDHRQGRGDRPGRHVCMSLGFGFDGWRGLTPLRHSLRNAGAIALATQEYAGNFFANSARPDYVLQTDQALGEPKMRKEMQAQIDERHRNRPATRIGRWCCTAA
jgi:phage portal protein BeeE